MIQSATYPFVSKKPNLWFLKKSRNQPTNEYVSLCITLLDSGAEVFFIRKKNKIFSFLRFRPGLTKKQFVSQITIQDLICLIFKSRWFFWFFVEENMKKSNFLITLDVELCSFLSEYTSILTKNLVSFFEFLETCRTKNLKRILF